MQESHYYPVLQIRKQWLQEWAPYLTSSKWHSQNSTLTLGLHLEKGKEDIFCDQIWDVDISK